MDSTELIDIDSEDDKNQEVEDWREESEEGPEEVGVNIDGVDEFQTTKRQQVVAECERHQGQTNVLTNQKNILRETTPLLSRETCRSYQQQVSQTDDDIHFGKREQNQIHNRNDAPKLSSQATNLPGRPLISNPPRTEVIADSESDDDDDDDGDDDGETAECFTEYDHTRMSDSHEESDESTGQRTGSINGSRKSDEESFEEEQDSAESEQQRSSALVSDSSSDSSHHVSSPDSCNETSHDEIQSAEVQQSYNEENVRPETLNPLEIGISQPFPILRSKIQLPECDLALLEQFCTEKQLEDKITQDEQQSRCDEQEENMPNANINVEDGPDIPPREEAFFISNDEYNKELARISRLAWGAPPLVVVDQLIEDDALKRVESLRTGNAEVLKRYVNPFSPERQRKRRIARISGVTEPEEPSAKKARYLDRKSLSVTYRGSIDHDRLLAKRLGGWETLLRIKSELAATDRDLLESLLLDICCTDPNIIQKITEKCIQTSERNYIAPRV